VNTIVWSSDCCFVNAKIESSAVKDFVFGVPHLLHCVPCLFNRWIFEDGNNDMCGFRQLSPDFSFLICHSFGKPDPFDLCLRKVHYIPNTDCCLYQIEV
jgi:hypothetical protein